VEQHEIVVCPKCQQKLRVPSGQGLLSVRCPTCENQFHWHHSKGVIIADSTPVRRNLLWKSVAAFVLISAIGLLLYFNQRGSIPTPQKMQPKWITIGYADLLDPQAIIRTGQDLKTALGNPDLKGALQPFIDQYSFLLQHSFEMISGSDRLPHNSVIDAYPVGSAQPAWVAILRGGRIQLTADNQNHTRVFLLGDDPEKSYQDNYSVIRHCLNALTPSDGSPLNVDVFAYRNDYASSELRLNLNPYSISAASFPAKGVPLDLAGLAAFFNEAPEIQGAQLAG
jgi:phage FluMu protein Com